VLGTAVKLLTLVAVKLLTLVAVKLLPLVVVKLLPLVVVKLLALVAVRLLTLVPDKLQAVFGVKVLTLVTGVIDKLLEFKGKLLTVKELPVLLFKLAELVSTSACLLPVFVDLKLLIV